MAARGAVSGSGGRAGALARLPWRGVPEERPRLPVPPQRMPLLLGRRMRKRWRWVGGFAENMFVFAAIVEIGPFPMSFWGIWDRQRRRLWEAPRRGFPVRSLGRKIVRRTAHVRSRGVEFDLELGEGTPIECMCPNGEGGYTWTRKLAGVPVSGDVRIGRRTNQIDGFGVDDSSAGYHSRYTSWRWS